MLGKNNVAGESKLTGDARSEHVLQGWTFYGDNPRNKQTGTMLNRQNWNTDVSPGQTVTIPEGYHNGSGFVRALGAGIVPAGWQLKTGTLFSGGFQTFSWNSSKYIPINIHISVSGSGNYYNKREAFFNINGSSMKIFYLEDIDPGSCKGSTEADINLTRFIGVSAGVSSCSFTQTGSGNNFSLTAVCTMWLEKV